MQSIALTFTNKVSRNWIAAWRYLRGGPGHFLMYVFGRFGVVRFSLLNIYRLRPRKAIDGHSVSSLVEEVNVDEAAAALLKDGLYPRLRLRPEVITALRHYAATTTCFAQDDFQVPFDPADRAGAEQNYQRKIGVGHFDRVFHRCPEVRALASDPILVAIARRYFGCEPALLGARLWWSFAAGADFAHRMSLGQGFHYDLDGYRALAFFFYLTDVVPSSGPHICVMGSHVKKPWKSLLSLHKGRSDSEIDAWYGKDRQMTLCGSAGFGFAEDIFCFHRGSHPEDGERLILQLRYGLRNYDKAIK